MAVSRHVADIKAIPTAAHGGVTQRSSPKAAGLLGGRQGVVYCTEYLTAASYGRFIARHRSTISVSSQCSAEPRVHHSSAAN